MMPQKSFTRIVNCELCKNNFSKTSPSHIVFEPTCKCYNNNFIDICTSCSKTETILCRKCNMRILVSNLMF